MAASGAGTGGLAGAWTLANSATAQIEVTTAATPRLGKPNVSRARLRGSGGRSPRSGSHRRNGPFLLFWSVLFAAYQRFQLTTHPQRPSVDRQHNRVEVY